MTVIEGLFAGGIRSLEPEGQRTGIFKAPLDVARVSMAGIVGDSQADRRYHGGPEKALHQFAQASYDRIVAAFGGLERVAVPGSIGENLSTPGLTESEVCIGDRFRIGADVLVEVSQPRKPCWKINHRFGVEKLSVFIASERITGWYYRVLEPGDIRLDDPVTLLERPRNAMTVSRFLAITTARHADTNALAEAAACPGLCPELGERLAARVAYLKTSR